MDMTLGTFIKQRREELGYSLAQVGQRGRVSKAIVSQIERNEVPNPTINTLNGIAKGINVPLETLARLAVGNELLRPALEREVAAIIHDLPPSDQMEILTMIETLAAGRRKRAAG